MIFMIIVEGRAQDRFIIGGHASQDYNGRHEGHE